MKFYINGCLFVILSMFSISCNESGIDQTFATYYAQTLFIYDFETDGTFTFSYEGHMGDGELEGTYRVIEKRLVTFSSMEGDGINWPLSKRLYMMDDDCIMSDLGHQYCVIRNDSLQGFCDDYLFQDRVFDWIRRNPEFKQYKRKVMKADSLSAEIKMSGIVYVDGKLFDKYSISFYLSRYQQSIMPQHLLFYADRCEQILYRGSLDSLIEVKL